MRLRSIAASVVVLAVVTVAGAPQAFAVPSRQGRPRRPPKATAPTTTTPIEHFVFLMQENHTFDNYFGTRPGVDGIPADVCMPVVRGETRPVCEAVPPR